MNNEDTLDNFGVGVMDEESDMPQPRRSRRDEEEEGKTNFNFNQWTDLGDGIYANTGRTQKHLDAAAYTVFSTNRGIFLRKELVNSDELIEFKDSITDEILKEIEVFWNSKKLFESYGFLHRRGYLFYGDAGCGKSGIVYLVINKIIKRDGIVLICEDPRELAEMVKIVRTIEPKRHIVVVLEDIDAIIHEYGEEVILSFLDGEAQADDVLNIATTNYPERLDRRIVSRPRRFDRRILIKPPSASVRTEFFSKKLRIEDDIEKWVKASEGLSFAGMTELVIRVKCLNVPFEQAVDELNKLVKTLPPASDTLASDGTLGFDADDDKKSGIRTFGADPPQSKR